MRTPALGVAIALLVSGPAAHAADRLSPEALASYGGTHWSDCADSASARVIVTEDSLVLVDGARRIAGAFERGGLKWFGDDMPEDVEAVLLGGVAPEGVLVFVVHRGAGGLFLTVDGNQGGYARSGLPLAKLEFRRCATPPGSSPRRVRPPAPPPGPVSPMAAAFKELLGFPPPEMLRDPAFKATYEKALGKLAKESWLAQLDGLGFARRKLQVAGAEYALVHIGRRGSIDVNNATFLYSAARKLVYGKVVLAGKSRLLGSPPPAVAKELGELWRKEWVGAKEEDFEEEEFE